MDPVDRLRVETRSLIDRYGFTKLLIGSGECAVPGCDCGPDPYSYTYTLGMCDHDSPEFVTFGLPRSHVASVVDPVCSTVMKDCQAPIGREHRFALSGGPTISFVAVPELWFDHDPHRVGAWFDLYAPRTPEFVQICWADEQGHMPWEPGCSPAVAAVQPVLADDPITVPPPADA